MTELILAVLAAVLISAMCSLFEAVLYSVPVGHIESMVESKRSAGKILQGLRENVDRPIAAILSLNTIANTAGAAVAGAAAAKVFGEIWLGYFSAAFTLAILLFSEVVPKTAGVVYSRSMVTVIARPLQLLVWLFQPFIWLCGSVTYLISREGQSPSVSEDEILGLARIGRQTGTIETDQAVAIENILSLEKKAVRDIMTPRTVAVMIGAETTVDELRQQKTVLNYSRIPIFDKDGEDVVGMINRHDVLTAMADGRGSLRLDEMMRPVDFVVESFSLNRLLRKFLSRGQHLLMVLDEFGGLAGLVTLEDVLEEILGQEIVDEFDQVADLRELARNRREETLKN